MKFENETRAANSGGPVGLRRMANQQRQFTEAVAVKVSLLSSGIFVRVDMKCAKRKHCSQSDRGCARYGLRTGLQTFRLRLTALEKKVAEEDIVLTERQVAALERKTRRANGMRRDRGLPHPGYLGSQDTFYVGNMKAVGRIYKQTFVDHLRESGVLQSCIRPRTPLAAADLLNKPGPAVLRTKMGVELFARAYRSRGPSTAARSSSTSTSYVWRSTTWDHTRTKAHSQQTNGICERFP